MVVGGAAHVTQLELVEPHDGHTAPRQPVQRRRAERAEADDRNLVLPFAHLGHRSPFTRPAVLTDQSGI